MTKPENFQPGSPVRCSAFRRTAHVIEGPNQRGQYLLGLGTVQLWVNGSDIEPAEEPNRETARLRGKKLLGALSESSKRKEPHRIDLHGQTVAQAIVTLERSLDRALLDDAPGIEIIHGLGSGALQRMVHDYLSRSSHVSKYKLDEKNPGTTWAYF